VKFLGALPAVKSSYRERIRAGEHIHIFTKYEINIYSKTLQYMMSHVLESSVWHIYMGRL
jgi:hypothetical protein